MDKWDASSRVSEGPLFCTVEIACGFSSAGGLVAVPTWLTGPLPTCQLLLMGGVCRAWGHVRLDQVLSPCSVGGWRIESHPT